LKVGGSSVLLISAPVGRGVGMPCPHRDDRRLSSRWTGLSLYRRHGWRRGLHRLDSLWPAAR